VSAAALLYFVLSFARHLRYKGDKRRDPSLDRPLHASGRGGGSAMTFEEILDHAIAMLQRRGRLTYRTLQLQFHLDDEHLEALKDELLYGQRLAVDEDDRVLVWTGDTGTTPPAAARVETPAQPPLTYTPPYLAEKILTSRSAMEGERKQVTVFFADLKGSTELIRDLDPEAAHRLLDPALHVMMDAVHRYEGTVNQVLGDGIMALFGAPVAHEDHAVRACYAALAMQAAMRRYAEEVRRSYGLEMQARVGLHSGEVVVRTIGNDLHMDYSAVGQTTHLAARMEQLATPGSIRLTAATLRLAEGLVQVNPLGPFPVKGIAEPVEVCELVGASTIRRRLQASAARGLTRFVGRQQELVALQQALAQAGTGHGQVVALVGEAGVGKSRLVYECVQSYQPPGWLVLESASVSYGKATPYFPVIDVLKRYSHVEERDDTRTIRAKMTGQVLTLDPALQDTVPALLWLLDTLPDDSPFSSSSIHRSAASTRSMPSSVCYCARAKSSPCYWSSRICTGLIQKRRLCSTAWSRVFRRPSCCSWSITARSISMGGGARPTTPSSGSTPCRRRALRSSCTRWWETRRASHPSGRS
jgi:class 3 adenylate cyclase